MRLIVWLWVSVRASNALRRLRTRLTGTISPSLMPSIGLKLSKSPHEGLRLADAPATRQVLQRIHREKDGDGGADRLQ